MKEDIKAEWVKRLRSGKIKQAKGKLTALDENRNIVGHCCLGVLCEMAVEAGVVEREGELGSYQSDRGSYVYPSPVAPYIMRSASSILPVPVVEWAGLCSRNPPSGVVLYSSSDKIYGVALSQLNDGGQSFAEIADTIERCL